MKQFENYILNKTFVLLFLLLISLFKSQLSINYTIEKIPNSRRHILNINIENNSNINYAIPIDTTGFRVYYPDEPSSNFYYEFADKGLGVMLLFKEKNKYIIGESRSHDFRQSDLNMREDIKKQKITGEEKLKIWQEKYKIKNKLLAKKNMYLFNNIIFLQPGERLSFQKTFDFLDFNNTDYYYNLYFLQPEIQYILRLKYSINKKIYLNLTTEQKVKLKGYKLFCGDLLSNESLFEFSKSDLKN